MDRVMELLRAQDVEAFNAWRAENDALALELTGADLSGLALEGVWLMGAALDGADLSSANLAGAILTGASLQGANFYNAELSGAIFGPPELVDATLMASALGAHLTAGARCVGACFEVATVTGAQFREVDLTRADFTGANHAEAHFTDAILEGAILPEAHSTLEDRAWGALPGLTPAQRRGYIQSLYAIACVDGHFDESEQAFLFMIAQRMELEPEEFEAVLPEGDFALRDIVIEAPEDPELRVQWLRNLILMVAADGVLAPEEYQTCLYFAGQLGFPPEVVEQVLASMSG